MVQCTLNTKLQLILCNIDVYLVFNNLYNDFGQWSVMVKLWPYWATSKQFSKSIKLCRNCFFTKRNQFQEGDFFFFFTIQVRTTFPSLEATTTDQCAVIRTRIQWHVIFCNVLCQMFYCTVNVQFPILARRILWVMDSWFSQSGHSKFKSLGKSWNF